MNENGHPTVSVIIPVFNGARYIRSAIESVLNQTLKDVEIIIADDGSTDDTLAVIKPWITDGTICYIYQNNKGVSSARNTAIRMAKGEFLKFLDSDDLLYPRQLELQVQHLINKPHHFISASDFEFEFEDKTQKYSKIHIGNNDQLARFIQGNLGPPHIYLVRRSMIEKIGGFDEALSTAEDSDLWLRVIAHGGIVERLDYLGCRYRILKDSLDSKPDRRLRNICKVYEKVNQRLFPQLNKLPGDILEQLLLKNISLIHRCFKMKVKPVSYLPTALKVTQAIYARKIGKSEEFLLKTIGIQNIMFLKYLEIYLTNRSYYKNLNVATWRNEQN